MPTPPSRFVLASAKAGRELLARLGAELRLGRPVTSSHRRTYLDTFDGRLHRAGLTLVAEARQVGVLLRLEDLSGNERRRAAADELPGFGNELPAGTLGEAVAKRIGIRRLLPLATAELRRNTLPVLDAEEKTVLRLALETGYARREDGPRRRLTPVLRTQPLRGYDDEHARTVELLAAKAGLASDPRPPVELLLAAVGGSPGGYRSKPDLLLDPDTRADAATKQVLLGLLATIEANEPGVRGDYDSEFLHDLRVAVRRSRSTLGQLQSVFPARTVARFQSELKWLGGVTGPLRDLDVFVLEMPELGSGLPAEEARLLEPLRRFLARRQQLEHRRLVRQLDSARYRKLLRGWRRFLERPVPKRPGGVAATAPISEIAAARIWSVYRKIRRRGRTIDADSPPDALHHLRIGCKKLRYLLELFGSAFDPREIARLVKTLKRLQDNLGAFNDAVMLSATLRSFAEQMVADAAVERQQEAGGSEPSAIDGTLLAMGRLIDQLDARRETERRAFKARWRAFDSARNRKRFRRLFERLAEDSR